MEKFTRIIAKEDIKTFDDAGIAQLGNLNKIIDEVNSIAAIPGPPGNNGFTWEGTWSNLTAYQVSDVVYYNGSSYFCTQVVGPSNTTPNLDTTRWSLFAAQGQQGIQGVQGQAGANGAPGPVGPAGLNWQGTWAATTSYVTDDAVAYNGASYFCILSITGNAANQPPNLNTTNWALLAAQGATGPQGPQGIQGIQGLVGPTGPQGPSGTSNVPMGNAVFVSKAGSDATGTRNNMALPFVTIQAALAAALTGDTVVVFPGDYELADQLVLRDQINFQFIGVGTVTLLLSVKKYIFDDSASIGAVNCTIYAPNWKFEGRGSTNTDSTLFPTDYRGVAKGVLKLTKASTVDFTAREIIAADTPIYIEGDQAAAVYPYNSYAGAIVPKVKITAHTIRKTADFAPNNTLGSVIGAQFAQLEINATDIIQDDPWTAYDQGGIDFKFCEKMIINADRIINYGEDGQCMYMQDSGPLDKLYLDVNYMRSGDGWTIWTYCGTAGFTNIEPEVYIRANRIDNGGDCGVVSSYTNLTIEGATIYNDYVGTDGILHCEFGGKLTAIGCKILRSPTTTDGADVLSSGTSEVFLLSTAFDKKRLLPIGNSTISIWTGTDYIKYKEVTISTAQLSTLFTTPVTLLAAPSATEYYVIDKILLEYDHAAGTAVGGGDIVIFSQDSIYTYARINVDFIEQGQDTFMIITPSPTFSFASNSVTNNLYYGYAYYTGSRDIVIKMLDGNPTNISGASMKVKIWYRTENKG